MATSFLFIKQGGYLSLRSLPGKRRFLALANPPGFLSKVPRDPAMNTPSKFKDVPHFKEKLKSLKRLIDCQRSSVALWEREMPRYDLLPKVKAQLAANEKLLAEITGGQACQ